MLVFSTFLQHFDFFFVRQAGLSYDERMLCVTRIWRHRTLQQEHTGSRNTAFSIGCSLLIVPVSYCQTGKINVRENRRGNQELTMQRHWQHRDRSHKTQDEDKQLKTTQKIKTLSNTNPTNNVWKNTCVREGKPVSASNKTPYKYTI